jgi:hypothetical protein
MRKPREPLMSSGFAEPDPEVAAQQGGETRLRGDRGFAGTSPVNGFQQLILERLPVLEGFAGT